MSVRHALLALLSEGPKYGLQLREEFEAGTGEVWPLNVGQVYTTLQRLERDGLAGPGPDGQADVIVAFFTVAGEIAAQIGELGRRIYPAGALWVAWPRRAAGHRSDITENFIRDRALPLGLVDVKVAAIDEDWSGLRLVWRVENRR